MTPTNEKLLMNQCKSLCASLTDSSAMSAYPQMSSMLYAAATNAEMLMRSIIASQRDELFHGRTMAAKVYEMITGKRPAIPEGVIDCTINARQSQTQVPLRDICDYMVANRPERTALLNIQSQTGHVISLNTADKHVSIMFIDREMSIALPDMQRNNCLVNSKLFETPYEAFLNEEWVAEYIYTPIYNLLVGDEDLEPFDEKYMIMNHFFGTSEDKKEVPEDHPVHELIKLLSDHDFGDSYNSYTDVIMSNGHRLRIDTVQDWGHHSGMRVLKISSVSKVRDDGEFQSIYHWYLNPLLVRDIIKSLDSMVTDLLETHHKLKLNRDVE